MPELYTYIALDIEKQIAAGAYPRGRRLPSIREVADRYGCSKATAIKAYDTLKNRHVIYSVPQSGYYVVEHTLISEDIDHSVIDFSTGNPLIGAVHIPDLKHCLDRAVDISRNYSLRRDLRGTSPLRELLPGYLSDSQVFTDPGHIFIMQGIQQTLSLLTAMPFPSRKDTILIEQPTYRYFMEFLKQSAVPVAGISRGENGIDLNRLEHIFKTERIKFFYTVPRHHNPTGGIYPAEQRKRIAELAAKYDVYIVEDDYFGDVAPDARYDPIYAYGDHHHHVFLRSFSKIIPWFRIGITVLPTPLLKGFETWMWHSYYRSYFSASLVSQATLDVYIRSKLLHKHVRAIEKELAGRLRAVAEHRSALQECAVHFTPHPGCFYLYLALPARVPEPRLINALRSHGVLVTPGYYYYSSRTFYEPGIRISLARTAPEDIHRGLEIIRREVRKFLG